MVNINYKVLCNHDTEHNVNNPTERQYHLPHFTGEKTNYILGLKSHSSCWVELRKELKFPEFKSSYCCKGLNCPSVPAVGPVTPCPTPEELS